MIYILHGDDIVALRKRLSEITSQFTHVVTLDADKVGLAELSQALGGSDLFLDKKCLVIEKILKLPKKELEFLQDFLKSEKNPPELILNYTSELSKVFLSKFSNARVEAFLFPKLFFTFLDQLYPRNFSREVDLIMKMENVEGEQIFYAMIKRIRLLLALKSGAKTDESTKMSPWQLEKVSSQAKFWTENELSSFYEKLFQTEKKVKSSLLIMPLKKQLDILLTQELH